MHVLQTSIFKKSVVMKKIMKEVVIFFVNTHPSAAFTTPLFLHTYKLDQYFRVFVIGKLFEPSVMLNFCLLDRFESYKENVVL
jgi:hypothetical protein